MFLPNTTFLPRTIRCQTRKGALFASPLTLSFAAWMLPALAACGHGPRPPGARGGGLLHPETVPSCTLAPATSPEDRLSPGELRVLVLDPAGQPIPSARVLLAEPPRVADSDLRGLVTFAGLPSGRLSWTLDKPGYLASWSGPLALQAEEGAFATCLLGPAPEALAFGR